MNRQQRRQAHRKQPVIIAGDGIIAGSLTGSTYEAKPSAQLPPKIYGHHRWIASAAWVMKDIDVEKAHDADTLKFLDHENLMNLAIGCWDCEKVLGEIKYDSFCAAGGD